MSLYLTFNAFSRRIQPRLPRERERWIDIYIYTRIITVRGRTINTGDGEKKERKRREKKTLILLRLSDPLKGIASRNNEDATFDWLPFRVASIADCSDCSLAHARDCALSPLLSVCERACTCARAKESRVGGREGG